MKIPILKGRWAVIDEGEGWELEHQHSFIRFSLIAANEEEAVIKGRAIALKEKNR